MNEINTGALANPQIKLSQFAASKLIIKESWSVLEKDKEVIWFPVLSTLCTVLLMLIITGAYVMIVLNGDIRAFDPDSTSIEGRYYYPLLFIYYIITIYIINFFEAGLLTVVQTRFSGQDLTFEDGMNAAKNHGVKIFWWSLISATVGLVLRIISDKSKIVGKIVSGLLGAAWAIMTYFSLPALVIGNLSVRDSFKESATLIRKNWGETIIVNFGAGLIFGFIIYVLCAVFFFTALALGSIPSAVVLGIIFVVLVLMISVIYSALNTIFKLALFNYARTGEVPAGFSRDLMLGSVSVK